jgi:putative FmdB family regulatory protein
MPLYEYECEACGSRFEKIRKFADPPLEVCDKCGKGPVRKLISSPAIQFKGSGWYITDYAKKSTAESGDAKPATEKSDKAESTTAKTESTTTTDSPKKTNP